MNPKPDNRPRFGWATSLDNEPIVITEKRPKGAPRKTARPVVVIPLPFMSAKQRAKIRAFVNGTLWPKS